MSILNQAAIMDIDGGSYALGVQVLQEGKNSQVPLLMPKPSFRRQPPRYKCMYICIYEYYI